MIVTCGQCQTRFKIPDDKVTDKGVKVRCTKCGNTFRVTREAGSPTGAFAAAAPPAPAGKSDPFAKFGAPAEPPPNLELTRPGVFALGVEATRVPDMRPGAPAARPPANAFDFSSLVPPAAPAAPPVGAAPAPFDFSAISSPAAPASTAAPAAFDFAALAAPAATGAGAFDFSALPPPPQGVPPPPAPPMPRAPPAAASATPAFDFSALGGPPPPAPASQQPSPSTSQATTLPSMPAFDFSAFGAPPPAPPPSAPTASSSAPWPPTSPSKKTGAHPAAAPAPVPAAPPDDFFAALPPSETAPHKALLDLPDEVSAGAARNALFDMPAAPPAPLPATEQVPAFVPPGSSPSSVGPAPIVARPATGDGAPRRKRTALGVVVNVAIAAVLVVALVVVGSAFLNEGKLTREALSFESLKNTFAPSAEFVAADISNGLYETRSGRSVFFVRGEVTNRTATATRVSLQADIVEGDVVVRSARGGAGAVPTPEELYALGSGDEFDKLAGKVAGRGTVVEPGASAPFLVVFYEYPPDLKGFRVRVLATRDAAATAQRP